MVRSSSPGKVTPRCLRFLTGSGRGARDEFGGGWQGGWMVDTLARFQSHVRLGEGFSWTRPAMSTGRPYRCATCLIAASKGEGFVATDEAARHGVPMIVRNTCSRGGGESAYYFGGPESALLMCLTG